MCRTPYWLSLAHEVCTVRRIEKVEDEPYWLSLAHEVCIPLHRCSDRYFLTISKNEAQISFSRYAHLLHRAVPQRFIKARNEALFS